ncbi:hypothetical protein LU293_00990 [Moraxella nasovis]|uniref:hypothetical protein n=1 Tax=Moraxella nasovis TaxID=2904121 RepID=UPI001F60BC86|nr:hypothetical protein [Moraxella nasovis]UNU73522.1 hypothetical protein LU293_00990 [Moraxella nasovis]
MEWLQNLVKNLPLEAISDALASLLSLWGGLVENVPYGDLPFLVYVVSSVLVILLWLFIMSMLPRPIKGMSLALIIAVLFAPGTAAGDSGDIVPAIIGVAYNILMKDFAGALVASLPILAVFAVLLFLGAIWQMLKSVVTTHAQRAYDRDKIQAQKQYDLQARTGKIIETADSDKL